MVKEKVKSKDTEPEQKKQEREKVPQSKNNIVQEKVKPKEPEPKEPNTETKCLAICVNAKFLKNPQHKCRICKKNSESNLSLQH